MIGKTISHYKILEKLGEGGMGVVYKAQDVKLDRTVALKFLSPQALGGNEDALRFVQEAQAAAALNHSNICTVFEIDLFEGQRLIAMEYVDGQSLKEKIESGPLPVDEAVNLASQIAEGLREAHDKGIVHRDIKPANVMITSRGQVKIMDFGLAKSAKAPALTREGTTLGTVAYMSPEQTRGEPVDNRTDLWSLGAVLHEMLTGQKAFGGDYEQAVIYSILNSAPEAVTGLRTGVPVELEAVIGKCLEKDPADRCQTANDLIADLRRVRRSSESGLTVAGPTGPSDPSGPRTRPWPLVIGAVVMAILAVVIIRLYFAPGKTTPGPSRAEAAENRLAIMYFENLAQPGDPQKLGEIVTSLLITDLSESRHVQVVSSQRLHDILKQLGGEEDDAIDKSIAPQVAERANARWMLLGTIPQVEPRTVLLGQLIDVASGNVIASQRIDGRSGEDVFSLVDKMTVEIKVDLSLPTGPGEEADLPIAEATTHSEEAYRYFLEGEDLVQKFYGLDALRSFAKAVELDSTLAMAYAYMGVIATNSGDERARGWIAAARRHSGNTTDRNRAFIDYVEANFQRDRERVIDVCERAVERWPDTKDARFTLGRTYQYGLERPLEAIPHYLAVIEMDPTYKLAYNQLAYCYDEVGEYEKAIAVANEYIDLAPDEANPYDSLGEIYALNGKLDLAIESYRKALEIKPDMYLTAADLGFLHIFKRDYENAEKRFRELFSSQDKNVRSLGRFYLALIPLHQGWLKDGMRILEEGIVADEMEGTAGSGYLLKLFRLAFLHNLMGNTQQALEGFRRTQETGERIRPLDAVGVREMYVRFLAENGMLDEADQVVAELKRDIEEKDPVKIGYYWAARSFIERARGDRGAAASSMEKAFETRSWGNFPGLFLAGRMYLEDGDLGKAVEYLERANSQYSDIRGRFAMWSTLLHYYLAQAYEKSGWTDKAAEQYEEFLNIWRDADEGLPAVKDARERLERLRSQS